jgi:hypothetical protein
MKNIYWRNSPVGKLQKSGVKLAKSASFIIRQKYNIDTNSIFGGVKLHRFDIWHSYK